MPIREQVIPNVPNVYRVESVSAEGEATSLNLFRVRKKAKVDGRWTSRSGTFHTLEEAKFFAKELNARGVERPLKKGSPKFEEVFERYIRHKHETKAGPGTIEGYRSRSRHFKFFHGITMEQVTPSMVDAWINFLMDPEYLRLQQKSRINFEHEYSLFSGVLKYYRNYENENWHSPLLPRHRERLCARKRADKEKVIRFLNHEQETSFYAEIKNEVIRDFAGLSGETGARASEVAAICVHHVDFQRSELRLEQHLYWERSAGGKILVLPGTKGGPIRVIPLTPRSREILQRRCSQAIGGRLFPAESGEWLTFRQIQAAYDRAFKRIGLPHRGTHTLRHTFAVRFLEDTKDIYALQRVLGHKNVGETEGYTKYGDEAVRRSFRLFKNVKNAEIIRLASHLGSQH